jgi:beta-lactamase class A
MWRGRAPAALLAVAAAAFWPLEASRADDVPGGEIVIQRQPGGWEMIDDPVIRNMLALDAIAPFEDLAPLWESSDPKLEAEVDRALAALGLDDDARHKRLAVALVDVSDRDHPRVASVNPDTMIYAASLPKIAVLLAAFEKIAQGKMPYDDETRALMEQMIRRSNNASTTELMHRVGKKYIARVLLSPRYRLYDPSHNGGLWVGKDYASAGLWRRDPLHNLSHGATVMQVARFYYLLFTDNLVTPKWSQEMRDVMSGRQHLNHKFVKGLTKITSRMGLYRKSGSWRTYHSDSALVERDGRAYIAVALSNDSEGSQWMTELIQAFDQIIIPRAAKKS